MTDLEYCFFCCDYVSSENKSTEENVDFGETVNFFESDNYKNGKENVLHISHYLKVSRTLIDQEKRDTSVIKACHSCNEISSTMSDYCVQLEIIKMKINYQLNLLTDRIIGVSGENSGAQEKNTNLSSFQKVVHQKCLLEARNAGKSSYPQICLAKCPNPSQVPVPEIKLEATDDHPKILEEVELDYQIKTEDGNIIAAPSTAYMSTEEIHSCPFCTFVVNGGYQELHFHIKTEHPEQFQTDADDISSVPTTCPAERQIEKPLKLEGRHKKGSFKCEKCGKLFSLEGNLKRHLRTSNICGQDIGDQSSFWGSFECSTCKRRYARKDYLHYHLKTVCKTGIIIDHASGKRMISLSNCAPKNKGKNTFTKCEYCGMLVYQRNLKRHVNLKHKNGNVLDVDKKGKSCDICGVPFGNRGNLKNHMLIEHNVKIPENVKMFECKVCDKSFELKRSLRKHLQNNEKCRNGIRDKGKVNYKVGDEEPILFLSIPEPGNHTDMIAGVHGNVEDDPLQM